LRFASPPNIAWLSSTRQLPPLRFWKNTAAANPLNPPPTTARSYVSRVSAARAMSRSYRPSRIAWATDITSRVLPFDRA
jgi:hypothetical protein